jgi:hypothetical protein
MDKQGDERQRLLWVIDFIHQDIERIRTGDFLKLFAELGETIRTLPFVILPKEKGLFHPKDYPKSREVQPPFVLIQDTLEMRELVKSVQTRVKAVFEKIYQESQSPVRKGKKPPFAYGIVHQETIPFVIDVGPDQIYAGPDRAPYSLEFEIGKLIYDVCPPDEGRYHTLKILKKCPAPKRKGTCGKFFLQIHQKEKQYCSNQCAWRAYAKWVRDDKKKSKNQTKEG